LVCDQVRNVAGVEPNLLGNTLENGVPKVNQVLGEVLVGGGEIPGDGDQSIDIVGASGCGQPIHQGLRVEEGHAEDLVGPMFSTPVVLRTKERDIPLIGPSNLVWADGKNRGGAGSIGVGISAPTDWAPGISEDIGPVLGPISRGRCRQYLWQLLLSQIMIKTERQKRGKFLILHFLGVNS
jgi:hypothetical protein